MIQDVMHRVGIPTNNLAQCNICWQFSIEEQRKNQHVQLSCRHIFHSRCLNEWALIQRDCPVCRKAVDLNFYKSFLRDPYAEIDFLKKIFSICFGFALFFILADTKRSSYCLDQEVCLTTNREYFCIFEKYLIIVVKVTTIGLLLLGSYNGIQYFKVRRQIPAIPAAASVIIRKWEP